MDLECGSDHAAMVGADGFAQASTNAPQLSATQWGRKRQRDEGWYVVVDLFIQISHINSSRQSLRQADIDIRSISQHCSHRPLPIIIPTFVLRSREVNLGRMKRQCDRLESCTGKGLLETAVQQLKGSEALFNRRADWGTDLDAFWQKTYRVHLLIGQMIAFNKIRSGLSMRRLYLETIALEIIGRNGLKSRVQCLELQVMMPQWPERIRVNQEKLCLKAKTKAILSAGIHRETLLRHNTSWIAYPPSWCCGDSGSPVQKLGQF